MDLKNNIDDLLARLEGAGIDLNDIAGAILDRLESDQRAKPLELAADPLIERLDRAKPDRKRKAPRYSPGERFKRDLARRGCVVVPFDAR